MVALNKPIRRAFGDKMQIGMVEASPLRGAAHDKDFRGKEQSTGVKLLEVLSIDVWAFCGDYALSHRFGRGLVPEGEPLDAWYVLLKA